MFLTIVVLAIVFGVLIFVHELGHFLVAKKSGVKVKQFALGFGPKIFGIKRGGTLYRLNILPWGGYVHMLGEGEEKTDDIYAVDNRPIYQQILISLAGVLLNFLFAVLLLWIGYVVGMPPLTLDAEKLTGQKNEQVIIVDTLKDSAAEKAGLKAGDIVEGFSGSQALSDFTKSHQGETIVFNLKRGTEKFSREIVLSGADAPLGVEASQFTIVKLNIFQGFVAAWQDAWGLTKLITKFAGQFFKNIFVHGQVAEGASGPVGTYSYFAAAIKAGWIYVLQLTILLSLNFAVFNFLPLPALDGGHLLFLILRGIFGKKIIKQEVENLIHTIGFGLLILLMIFITYRDIIRLR